MSFCWISWARCLRKFVELALLDIGGIVAGIAVDLGAVEPDDARGEAIEQEAVVGDDDDRAVEVGQIFFQPLDGGQVEVIGRFVQQKQIGLGEQELGEGQARALPAGKHRDFLFPRFAAQADAQQRGFHLVLPGVAAGEVELVLDVLVFFQDFFELIAGGFGHAVFEIAHLVREMVQIGEAEFGLVDHGVFGIEDRVLDEIADLGVSANRDGAEVGLLLAGEHPEEGGFARAVGPDEADAFAFVDGEVEFLEEDFFAEVLFDVDEGGDGHCVPVKGARCARPPAGADAGAKRMFVGAGAVEVKELEGKLEG